MNAVRTTTELRLPRVLHDPVRRTTEEFLQDYTVKQRRKELTAEQKAERKKDRDPMFVIAYIVITVVVVTAATVVWFVKP